MTAANQQQFVRLAKRADWMAAGACVGHDPNDWHPPRGGNAAAERAKAICQTCPVKDVCLQHALDDGERQGIWGGVSIANYRRGRLAEQRPKRTINRPYGPIPHGTMAGFQTERRRGLEPCRECRDARNAYRRALRANGRAA